MGRAEQRLDILRKLSSILKALDSSSNIKEVSIKTGIPTSTIQRLLNRKELFLELYELDIADSYEAENLYEKSQEWLYNSKIEGRRKGGIKSQKLHSYDKDELGHFKGSGKKI